MKTKHKITGMKNLQREKRRLALQIGQERSEIILEAELLKESLWPFRFANRFRKTADALSDSKLFIVAAQLAFSIFNTARKQRKDKTQAEQVPEEKEAETKHKDNAVLDFIEQVAKDFMDNYMKKKESEEQ